MQRFNTSDLERLEVIFSTKGFTYQAKRTDERQDKPPMLSLELKGSGTLEGIHDALRSAPFVLTDMSSRKQPDGLSVRLQLMQGKVLEDDGWTAPVENAGENETHKPDDVKVMAAHYQVGLPEMGE